MLALLKTIAGSLKNKPEFEPVKLHELNQRQSFWITLIAILLSRSWIPLLGLAALVYALKR